MHARLAASLIALLLGIVSGAAMAQEPPTVVVIFDGSGSMWGKPEGEAKSKLVLARDGLKPALSSLPPTMRLGLVSFGHRRSGDCGDVEVIVKPEPEAGERIGAVLDKHNPRGRGPITAALREAAKELGPQSGAASVILVHDDLDNCQADPCSAIGDLRRAHPRVAVHVVSLGMKREDAARMSCLAKATGGTHSEVATAQQALATFDGVARLVAAAGRPAAPKVAPAPPAAPKLPAEKPGLRLVATLATGGEPLAAALRWRVTPSGRAGAPPVFEGDAAAPLLVLPAGRYDIEAQFGFVLARTAVDVAAGEARTLTVPLGAGMLKLASSTTSVPAARQAIITFTSADRGTAPATVAMMRGLVPEIGLTPGTYQVTASLGSFQIERTVSVQAGKVVSFNPLLDLGELEATIAATADAPPLESASVTLFEDDPDSAQGRREVVRSAATQPSFLLPAGTYYAIARSGNVEQRDSITVKAGERTQRSFLLGTGRLAVSTALSRGLEAAEPVAIRAERVDDPRDATIVNRTSAVLEVAAGRYRIESRFGFANARIEREVEIKAGAREQISLEVPAGRPQLRLIEAARGLPLADVGWDIRDQRGQSVWVGQTGEARPLLLQGRYTARAEFRGRTITRDIDVRAGETRTFDLALPQ